MDFVTQLQYVFDNSPLTAIAMLVCLGFLGLGVTKLVLYGPIDALALMINGYYGAPKPKPYHSSRFNVNNHERKFNLYQGRNNGN